MKRHPGIRLDVRWIPRKSGDPYHYRCDSLSRMAARTYAEATRGTENWNVSARLSVKVNEAQMEGWSALETSLRVMLRRHL